MRAVRQDDGATKLWLSASDTEWWANQGDRWPCSAVAGHRLFVEFDPNGDLVGVAVNGRKTTELSSDELSAITSDFLWERYGPDHPAIR